MDGTVIPLPTAHVRARPTEGLREEVAVLSVQIRPRTAEDAAMPERALRRVHERCVRAALVVAGRAGAQLCLAGTSAHPEVEACMQGEGATYHAARTGIHVVHAVLEAQREERRLTAAVGIGAGLVSVTESGVRISAGRPSHVAEVLRDLAEPGEILLGGSAWREIVEEFRAEPLEEIPVDDLSTVPAWRLRAG